MKEKFKITWECITQRTQASHVAQWWRILSIFILPMQEKQETKFQSLEEEMAAHSSILAWRIPWIEELDRLQSTGSQRVGRNWTTKCTHTHTHTHTHQRTQFSGLDAGYCCPGGGIEIFLAETQIRVRCAPHRFLSWVGYQEDPRQGLSAGSDKWQLVLHLRLLTTPVPYQGTSVTERYWIRLLATQMPINQSDWWKVNFALFPRAGNWSRGQTSVQRPTPPHWQSEGKNFTDRGRGLHADTV